MIRIDSREDAAQALREAAAHNLAQRLMARVFAEMPRQTTSIVCPVCGDKRLILTNRSNDVGSQEYIDCPRCGPQTQ